MPEEASVNDTLGYALLKNGQADKSIAFLEKAARLRPNDSTIQSHLMQAYKAAGRSLDAKAKTSAQ
jgi:Flp pilus assembly protein TadD